MSQGAAAELAIRHIQPLLLAQNILVELSANREPNIGGALERLYGVLGVLAVDATPGAERELPELVSGARALVDRVREHRVPLSKEVLELLLEAVSFLVALGNGSESPGTTRSLGDLAAAFSDLTWSGEADRSDWELFVDDAREQLAACAQALRELNGEPERDSAHINTAFRSLHTFKGNCGLMGLARLEAGARAAEDALVDLRANEAVPSEELCASLLRLLDGLERHLAGSSDDGALHALAHDLLAALGRARTIAKETRLGDLLVARKLVAPEQVEAALAWKQRPLGEVLVELQELTPEDLESALREQMSLRRADPAAMARARCEAPAARLVQVQGARLEWLMSLVEELSQVARLELPRAQLGAGGARLLELVQAVHDASSRVHLLPLSRAFRRLELLVLDFSRKQGKAVELELTGGELEIERGVLEAVSTALLHTVRNAIDHGIEDAAERGRSGKPASGRVVVACSAERRLLTVRVSDDGRGLDRQSILARAQALGLSNATSDMSDERAFELIFLPGFSTASAVTDASGRGVGMDAVRSSVEALGGSLRLSSSRGRGTTVDMQLPLAAIHVPEDSHVGASEQEPQASGTWRTAPLRQAR